MRVVIFDVFETLVTEYHPNWQESEAMWTRLGLKRSAFWAAWHRGYYALMRGQITGPQLLQTVLHTCQLPVNTSRIPDIWQAHLAMKVACFQQIQPSILHLLERLSTQGLRLAVLSNAAPGEVDAWSDSPRAPYFEIAHFSCDTGWAKPELVSYVTCCQALGIEPHEAMFVGDGGSGELTGAVACGLHPVWATWFLHHWPPQRLERARDEGGAQCPHVATLDEVEQHILSHVASTSRV